MTYQFTIDLGVRRCALADLLEALSASDIQLRAISLSGIGRRTSAVLMTNNDSATHDLLRAAHYRFSEGEVVITSVPDQPGALAGLIRHLSQDGVVLHGMSLLRWHQGKAELALSTDDPDRLRCLLSAHNDGHIVNAGNLAALRMN